MPSRCSPVVGRWQHDAVAASSGGPRSSVAVAVCDRHCARSPAANAMAWLAACMLAYLAWQRRRHDRHRTLVAHLPPMRHRGLRTHLLDVATVVWGVAWGVVHHCELASAELGALASPVQEAVAPCAGSSSPPLSCWC
jgi:hypothetical protein